MSPNHFDQNVQVVQHKRAQTITQYPDGRVAYRETEKITTTGAQFDPHASPRLGPQKASLMERVLIAGKNKLLGGSDDASPRPGRPGRRDQSPRIANREYTDDELVAATNALSLHPSPHSPGEQRQFLPPLSPLGPYSPRYAQAQLSPLVSPRDHHRQLHPPASPAPVIPMMMHSPQPPPSPVIPLYPVANLPAAIASSTTAYYPTGPPTYVTPLPVNGHPHFASPCIVRASA
ncbi:hypothetical protein ONZ45_g5536 [Pleurotus djamor]|nr:hypothetical protein ONZ45_g5536 [Pleurotus djamor]